MKAVGGGQKMAKSTNRGFIVIDGDLRLKFTRNGKWYVVEGLDIRGLNTQGKTFEEALFMAHDAAKLLAEDRAAWMAELSSAQKRLQAASRVSGPGRKRTA
jgi:predicted RNase H-like HicB family nuclease